MNITNAIRILKSKKIDFEIVEYKDKSDFKSGLEILDYLDIDPKLVYKTITLTDSKNYFVAMIDVASEIDLKLLAKAFGVKKLELVELKKLTDVTGYERGGVSPIGMKKTYKTIIDLEALDYNYIYFSGGRIGLQVKMKPLDLKKVINIDFKNIKRV